MLTLDPDRMPSVEQVQWLEVLTVRGTLATAGLRWSWKSNLPPKISSLGACGSCTAKRLNRCPPLPSTGAVWRAASPPVGPAPPAPGDLLVAPPHNRPTASAHWSPTLVSHQALPKISGSLSTPSGVRMPKLDHFDQDHQSAYEYSSSCCQHSTASTRAWKYYCRQTN